MPDHPPICQRLALLFGRSLRRTFALVASSLQPLAPRSRASASRAARRRRLPLPAQRSAAASAAAAAGMGSLARLIIDDDPRQRAIAFEAIGELDGDRAAALLSELLHDPDPGVRSAAAAAAGRSRAAPVVFSLILCLEDPRPEVQQQAWQAIETITGQAVTVDLGAPLAAREQQIGELKRWWKRRRLEALAAELARKAG